MVAGAMRAALVADDGRPVSDDVDAPPAHIAGEESEIAAGLCACLQGFGRSKDEIAQSVSAYAWDEVLLRYEEVLRESVTIRAARVKI